jgi:hypothetical protein
MTGYWEYHANNPELIGQQVFIPVKEETDMADPKTPGAEHNFDEWLNAYAVTHNLDEEGQHHWTRDDLFAAWVGGAIFATNRFFNPTLPPRILPDIFRAKDD